MLAPEIDTSGEMVRPQLHDGLLYGAVSNDTGAVCLHVQTSRKEKFRVELGGVEAFQCDGFQGANTITDFWIFSGAASLGNSDVDEVLRALVWEPHPEVAERYHEQYRQNLATTRNRIAAGDLKAVLIVTAEICSVVALCTTVDVEKA